MQVFSLKTKVKHRHFSRKTKVKKYGFGRKTKVLLSSTTALDIAFATLLKNSLSIKLIAPISMNHPRRGGFFFTISPTAGVAGELKQHKKEPNMANKNTNPGGVKDDNEMRIQFGLILALCQNCAILHNPLFHAHNSNLFKGLPNVSIQAPLIGMRIWFGLILKI